MRPPLSCRGRFGRVRPAAATCRGAALALAAALLAAVQCGCADPGAMAAPGTLDASFGRGNDGTPAGVANLSLRDGQDAADAMAVQADGRIVVAGSSRDADSARYGIVVLRFNADGTPDASFGAAAPGSLRNGVVSLDVGGAQAFARAVAVQADGRIVVAGTRLDDDGSSHVVVRRLNADGTPDPSFRAGGPGAAAGTVRLAVGGGRDVARAAVLQPDGRLLVAGEHEEPGTRDIFVARLLTSPAPAQP